MHTDYGKLHGNNFDLKQGRNQGGGAKGAEAPSLFRSKLKKR